MMPTETKKKHGRPRKTTPHLYPGLRDDMIKLFRDNPETEFSVSEINARFPEARKTAVGYHAKQLTKSRVLVQRRNRGPYSLATESHRAALEPATPVSRSVEAANANPSDELTNAFLKRIEARLQEAHEFDIAFLRRLAR